MLLSQRKLLTKFVVAGLWGNFVSREEVKRVGGHWTDLEFVMQVNPGLSELHRWVEEYVSSPKARVDEPSPGSPEPHHRLLKAFLLIMRQNASKWSKSFSIRPLD